MSRIVATICGNAVAAAEKRTINSNGQPRTVATFRVAINRGTGDNRQTDYVRVSVWGQAADRLNIEKGDMVTVFTNDLHINSYTGQQDGQTHFNLECTSNWVEVGANKPRPDQGQQAQGQAQGQYNGYAGQQAQGQYNGYAAQGQQAQGQYNSYAGQAQPAQAQSQYNGYAAQGQPAQAQGQYNGYAGQQAQGQYNSYAGQAQPAQAQSQVQPQAQPASGFLDMPAGIDGELPFR